MTIWRMRIVCWIPKAKNTHSEYVILTDCPLQQWLQERASLLRYSTLPVLFSLYSFDHEHTTTNWRPIWTLPLFSRCEPYSGRVRELVSLTCTAPLIRHKWLTPMRQHMDWAHVTPVRESGVCPTRPMTLQSGVSKINQRMNALNRHTRNPVFQHIDSHRLSDSQRGKQ